MKRIFALILCLCAVLALASCGQTVKRPLITKNTAVSGELTTVTGGNEYLPEQRSWEDWEERVKDDSTVVLKVKKVSSVSYYWDDKTGVGGITDTTVVLQKVLLGYIDEFEGFAVGEEFHLIEPLPWIRRGIL